MTKYKQLRNLFLLSALAPIFIAGTARADLSIKRDGYGVPAIRSTTKSELFFGAGYAMARDRIGQISILRSMSLGMAPLLKGKEHPYNILIRSRYPNLEQQLKNEISKISNTSIEAIVSNCMAAGINQFLRDITSNPPIGQNVRVKGACYSGDLNKANGSRLSFGEKFDSGEQVAILRALSVIEPATPWSGLDIIRIFQNRVMNVFSATNEQLDSLAYLKLLEQANSNNLARARRIFNSSKWVADPNAATEIPVPVGVDGSKMRAFMANYRNQIHSRFLNSGPGDVCKIYSSPNDFAKKVKGAAQTRLAATEGFPINASNFWAESGNSVDGLRSLVFNGPQTGAIDPSLFYPINMASRDGFKYAGTTFAGTFFPAFGHNDSLAYGTTAANNGSTDLFCIEVTKQNDGTYRSNDGLILVRNPNLTQINIVGFYVKGKNWPVMLLDKHPDGKKAIAFVKRYSWQGHVVTSFGAMINASQAITIDKWNEKLDFAAGNFNLVSAHNSGKIAFRLTGIIPPRIGTSSDQSLSPWNAGNYLTSSDLRLPLPKSPYMGWRSDFPKYYKLKYSRMDGRITSWNHKPYLMMPDSDIIHASWFQWERSNYITDALNNQKSTLLSTANTNGALSLKDVYFGPFRQFLEKLKLVKLGTVQQSVLDKILAWNGYRDDAFTLKMYNEERRLNGGQVLFQLWMQAFADRFQKPILQDGSKMLGELWKASFSKLKQPKLAVPPTKTKLSFDSSSNIHLLGRIMLNNLHRVFNGVKNADPYAFDFFANADAENIGPIKPSQQKALEMMIAALTDTAGKFAKTYGKKADNKGNLPTEFRSIYGVSTRMGEGVFTSSREDPLRAPYFRNRGAQNHIVGFDSKGKASGYNEIPGGVREFRKGETKHTKDQMDLFRFNDYRPMIDLNIGIKESILQFPTLRGKIVKSDKKSKL